MRRMEWNGWYPLRKRDGRVYKSWVGSLVFITTVSRNNTGKRCVGDETIDGVKMGWIISNLFKTRRRLVWRVSEAARLRCLFPLFIFPGLFRVVWWESLEPLNYR
jgi:hypothetical protein